MRESPRFFCMAYFGINGVGTALTASTSDDNVNFFGTTSVLSANTVLALDGSDLIYLGAQGITAVASSTFASGNLSGASVTTGFQLNGTGFLNGQDVVYSTAYSLTGQTLSGLQSVNLFNLTGTVTSQAAVRTVVGSQIYGNAGNDSIYLGGGGHSAAVSYTSTTIGGGAGNDIIGSINYVNSVSANGIFATGSKFEKLFVEGGGDSDKILFNIASSTVSAVTLQGSQGNDSITLNILESTTTVVNSADIFGGGGNDLISGAFIGLANADIAGGGGNDTIMLDLLSGGKNMIYGDYVGSSSFDGSDLIQISAGTFAVTTTAIGIFSANTVIGGFGNDTVNLYIGTGGASINQYYLNAGNDVLSANILSSDTIYAGGGNDSISFKTDVVSGGAIDVLMYLGGDNDTLRIIGSADEVATFTNNTVYGGLGADIYTASITNNATATAGFIQAYDSLLDSTLSAMDTIALLDGAETGTYKFRYEPGGLSLASFSGAGYTATNGVVIFSATFNNNVTARAEAINSSSTAGNTSTFEANGVRYLFIAGSTTAGTSDDLVTQVATNLSAALGQTGGVLSIGAGKNISLVTYD